jgi:predicted helicase
MDAGMRRQGRERRGGMRAFIDVYNQEVDRWKRNKDKQISIDDFVKSDPKQIKWSRDLKDDLARGNDVAFTDGKIRRALYRPFRRAVLYYDPILNEEPRAFSEYFPTPTAENENRLICVSGVGHDEFRTLAADCAVDYKYSNPENGGTQCFPFFIYDEVGRKRHENVTDWALAQFRARYRDASIVKWDIFHYVYGLLHHAEYRAKFADNLKRDLPRIPLAPDFKAFADAGSKLAELHVGYESIEPWPLDWREADGVPLSYRVEKMRLSKDRTKIRINDSVTLAKIPPAAFEYRLGSRSALDWVVNQYQIRTHERSGIVSDPNDPDDEEYIVRLVGQVVRVSIETARIVEGLPAYE